MLAIRGHFDGSVIVPDEPVDLPLNRPLIVHIDAGEAVAASDESALDWLARQSIDDPSAPRDLADAHDHYLYGTPKKQP